jgi:hypothetical protein
MQIEIKEVHNYSHNIKDQLIEDINQQMGLMGCRCLLAC